eukprot:6764219-Lingulodinium_polyedra.AAC.1
MLTKTFIEVLQEGGLFDAVTEAGRRIDEQASNIHEYLKLYNEFLADPTNEERRQALEAAEAAYVAREDYKTFSSKGEAQPEYLKAMLFMDILAPRL